MTDTIQEEWKVIPEFPNYMISSVGRVHNSRLDREMRTNPNNYGLLKVTLADEGHRYDRSVARLVAEAFVDRPTMSCDTVVMLDGDFTNVVASNLAWRPRQFAWRYTHQLRQEQPVHYQNLEVKNMSTGQIYDSIVEAGMEEGLLFDDIWRSTYTNARIFPNADTFEIV